MEYYLVGRINVNKILHDKPTKRVAYCINLHFNFDGDIFHTLRMSRLIVGEMCDEDFTSDKTCILAYGDFKFNVNHIIRPHLHT